VARSLYNYSLYIYSIQVHKHWLMYERCLIIRCTNYHNYMILSRVIRWFTFTSRVIFLTLTVNYVYMAYTLIYSLCSSFVLRKQRT